MHSHIYWQNFNRWRAGSFENQKRKEGSEVKEELSACKMKGMQLFRDWRGTAEENLADHQL